MFLNDPLLDDEWIKFNESKWELNSERIILLPDSGNAWRLETVLYSKKNKSQIVVPPRNPYLPVLFSTDTKNPSSINRRKRMAIEKLSKIIGNNRLSRIIAFSPIINDIRPFQWNKFSTEVRYTYIINIDNFYDGIDKQKRKEYAKKINNEMTFCEYYDFEDICKVLKSPEDRKNFSHKIDSQDLAKLYNKLNNKIKCFCVFYKDELVATRIVLVDRSHAIGWSAGVKTEYLKLGTNSLLLKFVIDSLKEDGVKTFDFCGANIRDVSIMKESFGGYLTPYYCVKSNSIINHAKSWITNFMR